MDTPEACIEYFPTLVLTKIESKLTYDTLKVVVNQISSNAASVQTKLGGSAHGFLVATVSPTVYITLSPTPFAASTLPATVVTTGMTRPQILAANCAYDTARKQFKQYNKLQDALKKQLIAAVNEI